MAIKRSQPTKRKSRNTEDILQILCNSVSNVLTIVTKSPVSYSPMIQKISKTSLKPDIGTFVLFDGGFSGLVIINFSAASAVEIYQDYMIGMGMPKNELSSHHTNDEVGNILGELMNQIVGDFQARLEHELLISVNQSQPKMIALNKEIVLSINANIERPQSRKVAFKTSQNHIFYLEMSMEKTEFIELHEFEQVEELDPDQILQETKEGMANKPSVEVEPQSSDDLLAELGL